MAKPVILLGAGASMDAGLPNTHDLTKIVYDRLREQSPENARLFGFVIAKLLVRKARLQGSPFDKINIEEAYDTLKRLLYRDTDLLGEFVSSWEPLIDLPTSSSALSHFAVRNQLDQAFALRRQFTGDLAIQVDSSMLKRAIEEMLGRRVNTVPPEQILASYVNSLAEILNPPDANIEYLKSFLTSICDQVECIASLNYDTLVERAGDETGVKLDYGLQNWNTKRDIGFQRSYSKLLKLHGSLNWYLDENDDVHVDLPGPNYMSRRAIIFGGQSEKLTPYGPFLHLRQEFQRLLARTNILAIVGYSFSDEHLNAMIRSWVSLKRKAKLIIVDPSGMPRSKDVLRLFTWRGQNLPTLEVVEITSSFKDGLEQLETALTTQPNPTGERRSVKMRSRSKATK